MKEDDDDDDERTQGGCDLALEKNVKRKVVSNEKSKGNK